jgi:hypothetical protein
MNRLQTIAVYVVAVLVTSCFFDVPCFGFKSGDFQFWSDTRASVNLNKNWEATFEEEMKLGGNAGHFYYHHSDVGFVYKGLADWLSVGFNYKQVYEKDAAGKWREEHRPHLNATLTGKLFGLDVSDRSRLEYRDREIQRDIWRYRNKITVKLPIELTRFRLQPYFADEVFLNLAGERFDRDRFWSGFFIDLTKNIKGEIYYMLELAKSGANWKDTNVLGISLKVAF